MTTIEELVAKLGLDVSQFKEGMAKSTESVSKLNENMEGMQKAFAAGAIGEFIKGVTEAADQIVNLSENLGVSTDSLQALTAAGGKNGMKAEELQAVWARTKQELDKLATGNTETAHTFAMLGLKAEDFQGLGLDESLEKIARAYQENSDHAGTYDAVQQIVGKGGKNLTSTLGELADKGFGGLIAQAKASDQIISEGTLKNLAKANNTFEEFGNRIKVYSGEVVGFVSKVMGSLGALVSGWTETIGKLMSGALFSKEGRQSLMDTFSATTEVVGELWKGTEKVAESTNKGAEAAKKLKDPLAEAQQLTEARKQYQDAINKASDEGLSTADKLASMERQIAAASADVAKTKEGSVEYYKAATQLAKLSGEYAKLEKESIEGAMSVSLKKLEQQQSELPITEQRAVIEERIRQTAGYILLLDEQGLDISKAEAEQAKAEHDLKMLDKKVAEEFVKTASDLLSTDQQRAETAKVHMDLLEGRLTKERALLEINVLLAKGLDNLTDKEKIRLNALVAQLTVEQKKAEIQALTEKGINNLTQAERDRLKVLTEQVAAIAQGAGTMKQQEELATLLVIPERERTDEVKKRISYLQNELGLLMQIKTIGTPYESQSTIALEGTLARLRAKRNPIGDVPFASSSNNMDIYGAYLSNFMLDSQIRKIEDELAGRSKVSGYLDQYGEDAARRQFGDDATNKAMQDLSATSKQTAADIRTVADVLTGKRPIFGG